MNAMNEALKAAANNPRNIAVDRKELESVIERIERLEAEKRALSEDIRGIYAEARGRGFDAKAIREVVKIRRKDDQKRVEEESIIDAYRSALGID